MICKDCAYHADAKHPTKYHPKDCACTCQHRSPGTWWGLREANDDNSK
jgi:hypothetical protein